MRKFLTAEQIVILLVVVAALFGGYQWVEASSKASVPPDLPDYKPPQRLEGIGWLE